MKTKHLLISALTALLLCSCGNTSRITYFQDVPVDGLATNVQPVRITIKPADLISIVVFTQDPELTNMFNLPYVTRMLGMPTTSYANAQGMFGYLVDNDGNIDFPVLGSLHVAGLTRSETALYVKTALQKANLVKDPVVTVDYLNLMVSVLGEVTVPGRYPIDKDEITILDAISKAGDLTIFGLREEVTVFRMENGVQKTYKVDLCSAESLLNSPVYYLQQNDLIYVAPNKVRARQSTVNGNNILSASFWVTIANLLVTVLNYIK